MSKSQITNWVGNEANLFSPHHRLLGNRLYMTDIDSLLYTFDDHKTPVEVAIIDYKHYATRSISTAYSPLRMQQRIANKLAIPIFVILYRLEPEFIPTYYVAPVNLLACQFVAPPGAYFSLRSFSQLEHQLRKLVWNRYEPIPSQDVDGRPVWNPTNAKILDDLSSAIEPFPLPHFEIEM